MQNSKIVLLLLHLYWFNNTRGATVFSSFVWRQWRQRRRMAMTDCRRDVAGWLVGWLEWWFGGGVLASRWRVDDTASSGGRDCVTIGGSSGGREKNVCSKLSDYRRWQNIKYLWFPILLTEIILTTLLFKITYLYFNHVLFKETSIKYCF